MGYFAAANPVVRAISFSIAGFFIIMSLVYMAYIGVRALIRRQRNDSDGAPDPTPSSLDS